MAQTQGTGKGKGTDRSDRSLAGLVGRAFGRLGRWGGLVFLLAGLALSGWGAYEGAYLAGWAGTHGTLTVKQCEVSYPNNASRSSHKNRRPVRCEGTFVSDDGKGRDAAAAVQVRHRYADGAELSVQQTDAPTTATSADGDYVQGGMDRAWRFFGAFFGGWVLTGLGVFCLATGYAPFGQSRVSYDEAWDAAGRGVTRWIMLGMIGAGLAGAGVSFLVSYFV
ncbi:hypothetical protein ACFOZ0_33785 [Streptomyces yaanensis]|uniref:Uncharacterized protein n=1 Tax=Streptomyces yaanensis TaxID=1142239 RepID=A0ABV7SR29_9ACTN|nr:hypothetical protein [Streptomyces sp. CGMCC 4.7035]WNB98150.1 hypothetical protein Q2K21_08710 [Streptomyces sp. CGMCC 4.7035]